MGKIYMRNQCHLQPGRWIQPLPLQGSGQHAETAKNNTDRAE